MINQQIIGGFVLFLLLLGTASLLVSLTVNGSNGPPGTAGPTGAKGPEFSSVLDIKNGGTNASLTVAPNKIMVSTSSQFQEGTSSEDPRFETIQIKQKSITFGNPVSETVLQFNQSGIVSLNDSKLNTSSIVLTEADQTINGETTFSDPSDLKSLDTDGGVGVQGLSKANGGQVQSEGEKIQVINTSAVGESYLEFKDAHRSSFLKQGSGGVFQLESKSHLFQVEGKNAFEVSPVGTLDFFKQQAQILFGTNVSLSAPILNKNVIYSLGKGIVTSNVLLTEGNQTVSGIKTFNDLQPIQNIQLTSNQLLLGNATQKVTLNSAAKSIDLVVTIPAALPMSSFVLSEGKQIINGQKIFSNPLIPSRINVLPPNNQVLLGTGQIVTINANPITSSLIQTLIDVGSNSNFLMTEGTQIINGIPTFTDSKIINLTTGDLTLLGVLWSKSGSIGLGSPFVTTIQPAPGFSTSSVYSLDTTIPGPTEFIMSFTASPGTPQTVSGNKTFTSNSNSSSNVNVNSLTVVGDLISSNPRTYTLRTTSLQAVSASSVLVNWTSGGGTNWATKSFPLSIFNVDFPGFYIVEYQISILASQTGVGTYFASVNQGGGGPQDIGAQSINVNSVNTGIMSGACIVQVTNVGTQGISIKVESLSSVPAGIIQSDNTYCKVTFQSSL